MILNKFKEKEAIQLHRNLVLLLNIVYDGEDNLDAQCN